MSPDLSGPFSPSFFIPYEVPIGRGHTQHPHPRRPGAFAPDGEVTVTSICLISSRGQSILVFLI